MDTEEFVGCKALETDTIAFAFDSFDKIKQS